MALGSTASGVVTLFLRRAGVAVSLGVGVGMVGAMAMSQFLAPYLFRTRITEPIVYAGSASLLVVVALASAWLPARRASRTNPASVLRDE